MAITTPPFLPQRSLEELHVTSIFGLQGFHPVSLADAPRNAPTVKMRLDLLQMLPLDNKVLQHTSLLGLQPSDVESEVRSLRYLASQLPQVLESDHVSSLVDEWHLLRCDSANSLQLMEDGRIDTRWATVFQQKCAAGQQKYPLLSRLVKALLSLPHGNADCERGFSENKHLLEGRASLCIAGINGLRQVKTYLQRYDGDATKVPLSPDLLRSVKRARARYEERIGSREADMKRKKPDSAQVDADNSHDKRLKKQLEERGDTLPAHAMIGLIHHSVKPLVPRLLQCLKCFRNGHIAAACPNDAICPKCSQQHGDESCASPQKCMNCHQARAATSPDCPRLKTERETCQVKSRQNVTFLEAAKTAIPENDGRDPTAIDTGTHTYCKVTQGTAPNPAEGTSNPRRLSGAEALLNRTQTAAAGSTAAFVRIPHHTEESPLLGEHSGDQTQRAPTALQWSAKGLITKQSEVSLFLQRYPSPVLSLASFRIGGPTALGAPNSLGHRNGHAQKFCACALGRPKLFGAPKAMKLELAPDTRASNHFPIGITVRGCQITTKVRKSCDNWNVFFTALDLSQGDIPSAITAAIKKATKTTNISEWLREPDLMYLSLAVERTRAQRRFLKMDLAHDKSDFNKISAKLRRHAKSIIRNRWALLCKNTDSHTSMTKLWNILGAMTEKGRSRHSLQTLALSSNKSAEESEEDFQQQLTPFYERRMLAKAERGMSDQPPPPVLDRRRRLSTGGGG
ncbi:hypothetical protein HPB47_014484 [Ixodes persulcatus]|uniref:Uncharacterized protein n=1 Tax=Ixodes persulcatus TaxID=34615 RepID=A0AC60QVX3_IXOPE|nr:hypothetical protein HPB47_014484 [Ixodes persulcatus]